MTDPGVHLRPALAAAAGLLAIALTQAGCAGAGDSARSTARGFLDTHYVAIDLEAARALTVSLAASKLAREIELTEGMVVDADAGRPRINYSLVRFDEADDKARYIYELSIRPPGLEPFAKLVTLSLRSTPDGWRVTNYSESDP